MDRRTLLTIILCFGIFLAWQKLYIEPHMPKATHVTQQANAPTSTPTSPVASTTKPIQPNVPTQVQKTHPSQTLTLQTGTGNATIGDNGRFFVGWDLKDYYKGLSVDTGEMNLDAVANQPSEGALAFDTPALSYLSTVQGNLKKTSNGATWSYEDTNVKMARDFTVVPGKPYLNVTLHIQFKTQPAHYAFVSVSGPKPPANDPEAKMRELLYYTNKSLETIGLNGTVPLRDITTPVQYVGVQSHYFLFTLLNKAQTQAKALIQPLANGTNRISLVYPISGNSISIPMKVYFGPKSIPILRSVDKSLTNVVNFGFFTPIALPLLFVLRWFYQFVKNYGVAIILLTIALRLVTFPLTYKSMKSMKQMARLQPELQKIRDRFKDDKEAQNKEVLSFMREHGYNPASGCLPMLLQIPIFFALDRVLYNSIELYHAPFALWIHDLSVYDPYYITPILMSLLMFFQQKISPSAATDPTQQKMMLFMPLIFGAFMLKLPSGLTLYMLVSSLVGILQQVILNKKLNLGHVPTPATSAR